MARVAIITDSNVAALHLPASYLVILNATVTGADRAGQAQERSPRHGAHRAGA